MATEMVEYRPGRWVKVVDGQIIGRATAEEVAAWRSGAGRSAASSSAPLTLEVDLDPSPTSPGHSLDVPLRPAFERRGRTAEPPTPGGDDPGNLTVEAAIAREAAARRQKPQAPPPPEAARGAVMVRRRLPALPQSPAGASQPNPASEVGPLPKQVKPRTGAPAPATRRHQARVPGLAAAAAESAVPKAMPEPAEKPMAEPAEEPEERAAPPEGQNPSYWWICNAHRRPAAAFLREWMPKYKDKFGHEATVVLCHEDDVTALQDTGVDVEISPLLQPGHFYLGHDDDDRPAAGGRKAR